MVKTSGSYKSYIKNAQDLMRRGKLTYGEWIKRFGIDALGGYRADEAEAKRERAFGLADYGTDGERLSELGLAGSGYRDYIAAKNEADFTRAIDAAEQKRNESEAENSEQFLKYSDSYDKTERKLFESIFNNIANGHVTDYNKILEYANASGLTAERAELAAKSGYEAIIQRLKEKVLETIVYHKYDEFSTYRYAKKIGLPSKVAWDLSQYAKELNDKDYSAENHLEQLK
ncbi:MAG: hypothetical protein IIX96_02135 [Clostridia bacterium]|nr:hypothetical protein [Clostridia bacterium]